MPDAPVQIPGADYVGPAMSAAPVQIPGADYVGPAQAPAQPPAAPAILQTPEETARQQMLQENQQRGAGGNLLGGYLGNYGGLAGGAERILAKGVGLVSPRAAENMRIAAARSESMGSQEHSVLGTVGGMAGGLPVAMVPGGSAIAAANTGEQAYQSIEARKAAGENISAADEIANVAGQAGVAALTTKLGQKNITGNLTTRLLPAAMQKSLAGRLAAKAIGGAVFNAAGGIDQRAVQKYTTDPNTNVLEGTGREALFGAAADVAGGVVHEVPGLLHPVSRAEKLPDQTSNPGEQTGDQSGNQNLHDTPSAAARLFKPRPQPVEQANESVNPAAHTPDLRQESATPEEKRISFADYQKSLKPDEVQAPSVAEQISARDKAGQNVPNPDIYTEGQAAPAPAPAPAPAAEPAPVPSESEILARQQEFVNRRNQLKAEQRTGTEKTPEGAWVDHEAANIQDMLEKYGQHHGEDAQEALFDKVAAVDQGTPRVTTPAEELAKGDQKRQLFGARKGTVAIPDSVNKLFERDVRPTVEQTKVNAKTSWDSLNRALGTGANLNVRDRDTALNVRTSLGQQDLDRTRTEAAFKPYRDLMEKMSDKDKTHWVDQVEAIGTATDPKTQPVVDQIRKLNDQNIKEGEQFGLNTHKWDSNYIGRIAKFEGENEGTGNRHSIAGSQKFLKGRVFDTYHEFKDFVEAQGGKMRYDNPLDVQLAKQSEIRKSIEARKIMYGEEDRGQMKWVEDGKPLPDGMETRLNDPLAKQERPVIAPKWMVGKLAKMEHFDAQKYMESPEWTSKTQVLRPGQKMPDDFAQTGQTKKGQFVANDNVAGIFNNYVSQGITKDVPIWDQIVQAKRASVAANLGLSGVHFVLESMGNGVQSLGRALSNVGHGEFDLAAKNLMRANPVSQALFGKRIGEQAANPSAHPELEPLVKTSVLGGNKFALKSVLDENHFNAMKEEWNAGNKIGAIPRLIQGMYAKMHEPLFGHFVPALRRAAKAAEAETALRRGMSGDELQRHMGLSQDDIDNVMGTVIRSHQFQNKFVTDVQDLLFTAPKFTEGTLRFAGAATRDTLRALSDVAKGKKPNMTPAMYTALGGLMLHAFGGAATQLAYTYATTGKAQMPNQLQDYISPRTGRKDDQGRDERISLISPFSALFAYAKGSGKATLSRMAPVWHATAEAANNSDYRGVQIRNPNDSAGRQALDTAKHIGKSLLPFSVQNLMESNKPGQSKTADARVGDVIGAHFTHTSSSKAEQAARDVMVAKRQQAPLSEDQSDKAEAIRTLSDEMHSKNPDAWKDIRQSVQDGKISQRDVDSIRKRSSEKPGLQGLLGQSSLSAKDVMEQVWPKMTPQERRDNQWIVRGKIGRTETLTPQQRRVYFSQISSDVKAAVVP